MIDNEEIIDLIENANECEYLDFKLEEYDNHKYHELIKDIMAFANSHTKQNKYIIIGMKKKDEITTFNSINSVTDDADYQVIINEYIEPSITFKYVPFEYQNNNLAVFIIDENNCENRLFQIKKDYKRGKDILWRKGESRIRKGSSTSTLTSHDLKKIYTSDERKSNLIVQCYNEDKITNTLEPYNFDYMYSKSLDDKETEIRELINKISKIIIPEIKDNENGYEDAPITNLINLSGLSEITKSIGKMFDDQYIEDVKFDDEIIKTIPLFCEKYDIKIKENFFDIGELKRYEKFVTGNGFPNKKMFAKGKVEEEQKYKLINELYEKIKNFVLTSNYIESIKKISYLKLIISNIGNLKDDNILVSLFIPKNCLCKKEELKCSNEYGSALLIETYNKYLKMEDTPDIETYHKGILNGISSTPTFHNPLPNISPFGYMYEPSEEAKKQEIIYKADDILDDIYCYEYVNGKNYDVIKFELNKLIHNNKNFFPEVIVFKNLPDEIKYEIKSTELKEVSTGVLKINNN